MVEKGMTCVKYLLFAFNLLFFIFGLALLGVGIYVQIELNKYYDFFSSPVNAPAIVIIAVGALTLIIGFFGCCGAVKEHYCMTMTFAVLITLVLIIEIAGGIAGYVMRGQVNEWASTGMKDSLKNYGKSGHDGVAELWDEAQNQFECCGVDGASDYANITITVPDSCKGHETVGCLGKLEDFVTKNIIYVAGVAIGLGVVELIGIVLACCLGRAIRRESSYA